MNRAITENAITVENISKRYALNEHRPSLRHEAGQLLRQRFGRATAAATMPPFWALRNVSFTIQAGEAVGLIGRNGAGKSTLFRVLARITQPTEGFARVNGRCVALIALGAGFNPERSGIENIYLNAAIYGLAPRQVAPTLDNIIDFSELREFIDLPVKRYSSGMTARLGFSIAVHIAPEVMLIDEVLAVGDAGFQEKCIARIHQLKAEGRTLLFTSHDVGTVARVCNRVLWLDGGHLRADGLPQTVISDYLKATTGTVEER